MKKQIFLLIAIVCTSMAFAQIDEVKVKEIGAFNPYENKNTNYLSSMDFSADKNGNSFFYGDVYGKLGFVKLNKTRDKFDIDVKNELPKKYKYKQSCKIGDKLYNFVQYVNKENKFRLTAAQIDVKTGLIGEEKTIIETEELNQELMFYTNWEVTDEGGFVLVPQKDKIIVVYTLAEEIKSDKNVMRTVGFFELNENLEITANGKGVFPRNEFNKFSYYIDKYKNFVVLNNINKKEYSYEISYLLNGSNRFKSIKLPFTEKRLINVCFNELDSSINVLGYISSKKGYEVKPQSLRVYNINLFNKIITELQSLSISSEVLNDSIIRRMMRVNNPTAIMGNLFYEIHVKKLQTLADGRKIAVCSGFSFEFIGKSTIYTHKNLFVLYLDKEWKITKSYFLTSQNEDIIDNMIVGKDALYFVGRVYSTDKLKLWSAEALGSSSSMARYNNIVLFKYGFDGSYSDKVLNEKVGGLRALTKANDKKLVYIVDDYAGVYENKPQKLHYYEMELQE